MLEVLPAYELEPLEELLFEVFEDSCLDFQCKALRSTITVL